MKARLPFRALHSPEAAQAWAGDLCQIAHTAIAPIGTCSLLFGAVAAGTGSSGAADFLVSAGLLLHFSVWFERWWTNSGRA
ncbi:MAG: hypothetical protein ACXWC4_03055 [Telluria sp.]